MKKQFIPYILFVACLFSACSTYYDEPDPVTPGEGEMLSLTVTASDIEASDTLSSRSSEVGKSTIFEPGDTVGLVVLDKAENLLVDNVPYKYDGSNWNFVGDADKQPYYDAAMWDYIVYYPYKKEVDGCRNIDDIKSKDVFKPQENQSDENTYQKADILVWTPKEKGPIREIEANMEHVYDSFIFRIDIKWDLRPIQEELVYQPIQQTLKDFTIKFVSDGGNKITALFDNDDPSQSLIYRAEDGSYRYLLSSGKEGTIMWQYTYRNITFRGEQKVVAEYKGKRFVHYEKADMGELPGPNMQISDFYCRQGNIGYVFPWDAADQIDEKSEPKVECFYGRHCIGIVVGVGQHDNDFSDYTKSDIPAKICHGYAMALTDSGAQLEWAKSGNNTKLVGTYYHFVPDRAIYDWNGFYNNQKIQEYILLNGKSWEDFPAANACRTYGKDCGLESPGNTTGWFLPSAGMINFVWKKNDDIETALETDKISALLNKRFATIKKYLKDDSVYKVGQYNYIDNIQGFDKVLSYWSSNEVKALTSGTNAYIVNIEKCITNRKIDNTSNNPAFPITVRPFLAF